MKPLNEAEAFRAQELLLDRAMYGLDPAGAAELATLGADGDESFDLAAAALDVATVRIEPMPAGLAERILAAAGAARAMTPAGAIGAMGQLAQVAQSGLAAPQTLAGVVPARSIETRPPRASEPQPYLPPQSYAEPQLHPGYAPQPQPLPVAAPPRPEAPVIPLRRPSRAPVIVASFAAAACLALAVGAVLWARGQRPGDGPAVATVLPAEARAELLASAGDAATLAWKLTGDAAATAAAGDVVWSASKQRGFMRFQGLAPNDPKVAQYQLWIFDKLRDDKYPVDGGVFDVSSTGEVIVPISAKLPVGDAVLFAVTVEQPGGVVVSKRERIVVTAAPASAG